MSNPVLVAKDGAIATVTLNNPRELNALNRNMWERLAEAMLALSLEGRILRPPEALKKRLINRVVRDDAIEAEVYASATRIADGSPLVARWHKQFVERLMVKSELTAGEPDESYTCFDSEDYGAGIDAFLKRTQPVFRGA